MGYELKKQLDTKDNLIKLKDEQVKTLENSLQWKDEQIKMLENRLKITDERTATLEKTINKLKKQIKDVPKKAIPPIFEVDLSNKDRILNLLKSKASTSKEIAKKLSLSEQDTRTYLLRLKKEDKIKTLEKKGRYYIYTYKMPYNSENSHIYANALEYDLSYMLNLLEMKMDLKEGEELSPTDLVIIRRIQDRVADKREDIIRGVEVLKEFVQHEKSFRNEIDARITELETKINGIKLEEVRKKSSKSKKQGEISVYQYNDATNEYQELILEEAFQINELLDPDFILLFVDRKRYRIWIWHGSNTTTRMKFIAAKLAPSIRDQYGIGFKISAVDEGNETLGFRIAAGLEEEVDYTEVRKGPAYEGAQEDLELLESLSKEKILLLLEKAGIPERYERKRVIVNNKIFEYKEIDKNYLGSDIKETQLIPLKENIENGTHLAENYVPRMLFVSNNLILIELLQKIKDKIL